MFIVMFLIRLTTKTYLSPQLHDLTFSLRVDLCVGTPVDELKGHCEVTPKKKKQTEQVYLWTGTSVDISNSRTVNG